VSSFVLTPVLTPNLIHYVQVIQCRKLHKDDRGGMHMDGVNICSHWSSGMKLVMATQNKMPY